MKLCVDITETWLDHFSKLAPSSHAMDDFAKDGGEELFTKMHRVLQSNSCRIVKDS